MGDLLCKWTPRENILNIEISRHNCVASCLVNNIVQSFCSCCGIRYPINWIEESSVVSHLTWLWSWHFSNVVFDGKNCGLLADANVRTKWQVQLRVVGVSMWTPDKKTNYYIDTDEIPGFLLLLKYHILTARSEHIIFIFQRWGCRCRHGNEHD